MRPYWRLFILVPALLLSGCGSLSGDRIGDQAVAPENKDLSCSYFYFLWGTHAEFDKRYAAALDAYEKALVCDSSAEYIRRKLPLLLLRTGDTEQAIELLEQAIELNPEDTARRTLLASIFLQQKDTDSGVAQYKAIISYDPENEQILFRLGALFSQNGSYDRARYYLLRLLELNQNAYFAHVYLARIAQQLKETDTAEYHYLKALELNWSADFSYEIADFYSRNNAYGKALDLLRTALEKDETDEQARLGIVQALLAQDLEEEAIAELSLAKQYSNTPEKISLVLSRLYLKNGEDQKAVENLLAVLEQTDSSEARYLLGVIYSDRGKFQDAVKMLDGITPDQEAFEDAVFLKTKILHQTGQIDEALAGLESYLASEETGLPIFYVLAASLYQDSDDSARSSALLLQGIKRYPEDERLLFEYGLQLERTNRLEEAIPVMEQIIEINPDHAEALNFVGYTWADSHRNLEKALAYISRAMELKPGNGYIQDSLGWAYFRLGKLNRAEKELLAALELLPEDPHIHDHLGDVYRALGQVDKARTLYLTAIEKFDDEKKKDGVQKKLNTLDER